MHLMRNNINDGVFQSRVAILEGLHHASETTYLDRLTDSESRYLSAINNNFRRDRWIAGRMAAKYLMLKKICDDENKTSKSINVAVDQSAICEISTDKFLQIEILPRYGKAGNPPVIFTANNGINNHNIGYLCITHSQGISVAMICDGKNIGIDIERSEWRQPQFYNMHFTESENAWVKQTSEHTSVDEAWYFTLLWTIKEALIKTELCIGSSIWSMRTIEISMPSTYVDWSLLHKTSQTSKAKIGEVFNTICMRANYAGTGFNLKVFFSAYIEKILTVIEVEGNDNERTC